MVVKRIKCITLNARGLVNAVKRKKLFYWFEKQKVDIICIQETHCNENKLNVFKNSWKGYSWYGLTTSQFSKGVGILFSDRLNVSVENCHVSENGRLILLNVELEGKPVSIINVYAPNHENERSRFFKHMNVWVNEYASYKNDILLTGDFNCCINDNDRLPKTHLKDKSRIEMSNMVKKIEVIDMWNHSCSNKNPHYTWSNKGVNSRLDYIYLSKKSCLQPTKMENVTVISDAIGQRITDHKALILYFDVHQMPRGPNYWKMNVNLLNDNEYKECVTKIITNTHGDEMIKNLSYSCRWEMLKSRIKEYSIKYGIQKAKEKRDEMSTLENELMTLNQKTTLTEYETNRKSEIQNRLNLLYNEHTKGNIIRARIDIANENECNKEILKGIEKSKQSNNTIDCLVRDDGTETTNHKEILSMLGEYYEKLYDSKYPSKYDIESYLNSITFDNIIPNDLKEKLEQPPDKNDFEGAINNIKTNKTPGIDGLPIEFYKTFWKILEPHYTSMIFESYDQGTLPFSTKTSVLSLLHKNDSKKKLKNYRPLSITNIDYKIIAYIFSQRLRNILPLLIHEDQTACIKERYIGSSVRNIIDIFDHIENNELSGAMICADFEKAYDSVEYNFLFTVLRKFNFGEQFIRWIQMMYKDSTFKVKNNGWISSNYIMKRGIKQG